MPTTTATLNRRTLLAPTPLGAAAAKPVTALIRSGATATATSAGHGYSAGDWLLIQGADRPYYNGPFQVVAVVDPDTFTYAMEGDPGATAGGTITSQKGVGSAYLWGDGTTPAGSPASVGALPTAIPGGEVVGRITNGAVGPTVPASMTVWASDAGLPGTWRLARVLVGSAANAADATPRLTLPPVKFVLVFFYGNAGQAVYVDVIGNEWTNVTG